MKTYLFLFVLTTITKLYSQVFSLYSTSSINDIYSASSFSPIKIRIAHNGVILLDTENSILVHFSENDTISRIEKFQEINSNIELIIENYNGPSQALNKALLNAKGEFIAWLNSDDKFEINSFQRSLAYFNKNQNCKILYMDMENIFMNKVVL